MQDFCIIFSGGVDIGVAGELAGFFQVDFLHGVSDGHFPEALGIDLRQVMFLQKVMEPVRECGRQNRGSIYIRKEFRTMRHIEVLKYCSFCTRSALYRFNISNVIGAIYIVCALEAVFVS